MKGFLTWEQAPSYSSLLLSSSDFTAVTQRKVDVKDTDSIWFQLEASVKYLIWKNKM